MREFTVVGLRSSVILYFLNVNWFAFASCPKKDFQKLNCQFRLLNLIGREHLTLTFGVEYYSFLSTDCCVGMETKWKLISKLLVNARFAFQMPSSLVV